jgi:hypothetical protein
LYVLVSDPVHPRDVWHGPFYGLGNSCLSDAPEQVSKAGCFFGNAWCGLNTGSWIKTSSKTSTNSSSVSLQHGEPDLFG